ncbi:uncharacterized protein LOC123538870 [Mercenaria mercenaria]|uniref:uncharacterized protein LOC123538870 n=1 Tax=Mercenaria mercenaria TaxID=6596 RepID=UPI00234FAA79|nr:uncharacterized protein LOC123538870 [Mercenaria mercenaria]
MDEFTKDSGYQNFICVYLAFAYVGYQLKGYTATGLKKVHANICSSLGNEPKCTSRCSEQYGRDVKKWCKSCGSWQSYLQKYMRVKTVAWERMESWKWPTSYIDIAEVFVPTICSMHTINLQDLYIESYIWANCNVFKIQQSTLKNLREARNAVVHNSTTCVTDTQTDNCFNTLQTLLSDPDVNTYVNDVECKEFLFSLLDRDETHVSQQQNRILSKFGGIWVRPNRQDETKINDEVSRNVSYYFRAQNIHKEFHIHQNILKSLTTVMIRPYWKSLRFAVVQLVFFLLLILISLLYVLFARSEGTWRLALLDNVIFFLPIPLVLVVPYLQNVMQHHIIRYSQQLILRQLQRTDAQSPLFKKPTGNLKNSVTGKG